MSPAENNAVFVGLERISPFQTIQNFDIRMHMRVRHDSRAHVRLCVAIVRDIHAVDLLLGFVENFAHIAPFGKKMLFFRKGIISPRARVVL